MRSASAARASRSSSPCPRASSAIRWHGRSSRSVASWWPSPPRAGKWQAAWRPWAIRRRPSNSGRRAAGVACRGRQAGAQRGRCREPPVGGRHALGDRAVHRGRLAVAGRAQAARSAAGAAEGARGRRRGCRARANDGGAAAGDGRVPAGAHAAGAGAGPAGAARADAGSQPESDGGSPRPAGDAGSGPRADAQRRPGCGAGHARAVAGDAENLRAGTQQAQPSQGEQNWAICKR